MPDQHPVLRKNLLLLLHKQIGGYEVPLRQSPRPDSESRRSFLKRWRNLSSFVHIVACRAVAPGPECSHASRASVNWLRSLRIDGDH